MIYKSKYYEIEIKETAEEYCKSPENVMALLKEENDIQEKMIVFGMNIKNKVIYKKVVAIGGHNVITISPADIFIPLLKLNVRSFILAHNHPSNDTSPSKEDIIFTKRIEKGCEYVGLNLIDHLIFNDKDFYSFKKNQLL